MWSLAEHAMQVAVVDWAQLQATSIRPLQLLYAIPNGGRRPPKVGREMKAEGARAGVPDLNLPVRARGFIGLWVEMKSKDGVLSGVQAWWRDHLLAAGHDWQLCRTIESAIAVLRAHALAAQNEFPEAWTPKPSTPKETPMNQTKPAAAPRRKGRA